MPHATSQASPWIRRFTPLIPAGASVLDVACGQGRHMRWLAEQGHAVLGVELSPVAVQQFFAEHGWQPRCHESRHGRHYSAGAIELICGDAFGLDAEFLADCSAVFDRAALIALPPALRQRYAGELQARLPAGCRGLLITLEYPQAERDGPPFSVPEQEVRSIYSSDWRIDLLERRPIPPDHPGFVGGVSRVDTAVYGLHRG